MAVLSPRSSTSRPARTVGMPAALRSKATLVASAILIVLLLFIYTPLPEGYPENVQAVTDKVWRPPASHNQQSFQLQELRDIKSKNAFVTLMAQEPESPMDDHYFLATRLLTYQLVHAPETKSSIPLVIMVTKFVSEKKRNRLRKDGAIVVEVEDLRAEWIYKSQFHNPRYGDVMTKLRAWELTQFELLCFIDIDMVVTAPLDGVFNDPAVKLQTTKKNPDFIKADEAPHPPQYLFAATREVKKDHDFPPSAERDEYTFGPHYLNSGFMVFRPSPDILNYYKSLLDRDDGRYGEGMPEQNLLNWAHRNDGNMPWTALDPTWNIFRPTVNDMEKGVKSLHEKYWNPEHEDLKPHLEKWRWRMQGFYEARDTFLQDEYARYGLGDA